MARPNRTTKPDTIDAVAQAAGVSTMTVSRVMRGQENVSGKTKTKVLEAAQALGYIHNRLASSLASSSSAQIAVIIPSLRNSVFPEVLAGITDTLDGTGFQAVIGVTDYDLERERDLVTSMMSWRPAGMIITNTTHHEDVVRILSSANIPVVEVMELSESPIDMCVGLDHREAGREMALHLIEKKYRGFGYLGTDHEADKAAAARFEGFREILEENGLPFEAVLTIQEPSGIGLGRENMKQLLAMSDSLDAVYFSNDSVAAGAMMYCMAEGIEIPDQLALASFSGLEIASAMPIPITTISSPRYNMGTLSTELVLARIKGKSVGSMHDSGFQLCSGASA